MVHHTPPAKAEAENVSVFFPPCSSILWVLCDQYGCDPLVWLLIQWCINLTHVPKDGLTAVSTPVWIVGAHGTSYTIQGRWWKCPSFHPSTHGTSFGMYDQYGCDPLVCLPVLWCINLTHASIDELREVSISILTIGDHGISHIIQGRGWKCPSFHLSTNGISCGCCVASIDVIPLLGCLYNGGPTPHVYILINWEWHQHLFGWLELMVYHTPSKVEAKHMPFYFPPCSSILLVLCDQYECYLLAWLLV